MANNSSVFMSCWKKNNAGLPSLNPHWSFTCDKSSREVCRDLENLNRLARSLIERLAPDQEDMSLRGDRTWQSTVLKVEDLVVRFSTLE
jgi:hypothetical protein